MSIRKSISKRIRITRNGKIVRRPMGVDHFRTRKTKKNVRSKRRTLSIGHAIKTIIH